MKIKASELIGAQLDWAVAQASDFKVRIISSDNPDGRWQIQKPWMNSGPFWPSQDWSQGGPLIDKHNVFLGASLGAPLAICRVATDRGMRESHCEGPTKLIAAMRAIVAAKLGDEIEVPEELI